MILRTTISLILLAVPVHAEVVRIDVQSRADLLAGRSFGTAGPYEKLSGTIYFAVDPRNGANQIIADIDKAPKNADGRVEFSSTFYLIKPKDPSRGNGTLLYEVSNRGGKAMIGFFNRGVSSLDPQTVEQFGDGFLLEQGFTLLWVGWQFDPPLRDGLVRVSAPIAREADGRSIRGVVRSDFVPLTARRAGVPCRSRPPRVSRGECDRPRQCAHGARIDRRFAPHDPARSVAVHRGWHRHPNGDRFRAGEDL